MRGALAGQAAGALFKPAEGCATYLLPAVFLLICHQRIVINISVMMVRERRGTLSRSGVKKGNRRLSYPAWGENVGLSVYYGIAIAFPLRGGISLFKTSFMGPLWDILFILCPFCLSVFSASHVGALVYTETGAFFPSTHGIEGIYSSTARERCLERSFLLWLRYG